MLGSHYPGLDTSAFRTVRRRQLPHARHPIFGAPSWHPNKVMELGSFGETNEPYLGERFLCICKQLSVKKKGHRLCPSHTSLSYLHLITV